jgi:hypothetical protein
MTLMVLLPAPLPGDIDSPCLSVTRDFANFMRKVRSVGSNSKWYVSGAWYVSRGVPVECRVRRLNSWIATYCDTSRENAGGEGYDC